MWDEEESNAMMHSLCTDCTALCLSSVLLCVSCCLAQIPLVSLYTDFLVVDIRCSFTLRAWSCASCR